MTFLPPGYRIAATLEKDGKNYAVINGRDDLSTDTLQAFFERAKLHLDDLANGIPASEVAKRFARPQEDQRPDKAENQSWPSDIT